MLSYSVTEMQRNVEQNSTVKQTYSFEGTHNKKEQIHNLWDLAFIYMLKGYFAVTPLEF